MSVYKGKHIIIIPSQSRKKNTNFRGNVLVFTKDKRGAIDNGADVIYEIPWCLTCDKSYVGETYRL